VETLGLDATDLAKLEVARRSDVVSQLAAWGGGIALGDSTRDRVSASSAVAVITVHGTAPADYVRGGMALEEFWIRAEDHGLAVHPVSPVFLYAMDEAERSELSVPFLSELTALQERFQSLVGYSDTETPILVLRLSHDAPPPRVRSQRLDRGLVVSTFTSDSDGLR
jgi:hypothetical protein